jgi:hypothetical protein
VLLPTVNVDPSGRLLKVPVIGLGDLLLITVKTCALRERLIAQSNKGEKGAAVDRHAFGCDLVGLHSACIDLATVNAVGIKSEGALSR